MSKATIDLTINEIYNKFSPIIWVSYTLIGIYALIVCLFGYCGGCGKKFNTSKAAKAMNKDIKASIFRRQIIYFIVLLIMETPYAIFVMVALYHIQKKDYGFL
jgi:predicted acyltransferase